MMFERCHTRNRKSSSIQRIKYFNFRKKVQLDHPVHFAQETAPLGDLDPNFYARKLHAFREFNQNELTRTWWGASLKLSPRTVVIRLVGSLTHGYATKCRGSACEGGNKFSNWTRDNIAVDLFSYFFIMHEFSRGNGHNFMPHLSTAISVRLRLQFRSS